MTSELRVLEAARAVIDDMNDIIARSRGQILYEKQLCEAAGSIAANIREAYGRRPGAERNLFLRYARGSAEEADEHLRANHAARRIASKCYWRAHNRLAVIVRMLNRLMSE